MRIVVVAVYALLAGFVSASADETKCLDRCISKYEGCGKVADKNQTACEAKVERWRRAALNKAAKAKESEKAKGKVEARYAKKRKACIAAHAKATGRCMKRGQLCETACKRKAKAKKVRKIAK